MMDFLHYFKKVGDVNKRGDWDESITSAREMISASSAEVDVLQGGIPMGTKHPSIPSVHPHCSRKLWEARGTPILTGEIGTTRRVTVSG